MKRFCCAILIFALTLCAPYAALGAGETYEVYDCNEYITLRVSPSTKADAVARVPLGASVVLISTAENGFYRVWYNEDDGYVLAKYLTKIGDRPAAKGGTEITDTLLCAQRTALNQWLSAFAMTDFMNAAVGEYAYERVPYAYTDVDWGRLVRFAIYHSLFTGDSACLSDADIEIDGDTYSWRIAWEDVNAAANLYFDRGVERASTIEFSYLDGWFYFEETGGSAMEGVAVVTALYDMGDGVYRAVFNRYIDSMTADDFKLCEQSADDVSARWLGTCEATYREGEARVLLSFDEYR